MAIEKLVEDISYISKLDTEPNDVGGLTADEFKAEFDKGVNAIKNFINEVLIPALEAYGVETGVIYGTEQAKYIRVSDKGMFETSPNGVDWFAATTRGEKGEPGPSAYDTAKEAGYTGTEEEFTAGLIGMPSVVTDFPNVKSAAEAAFPATGGIITGDIILTEGKNYGLNLPSEATKGRLFFKKLV